MYVCVASKACAYGAVCAQVQWSLLSRSPATDGFQEVARQLSKAYRIPF